MSEGDVAFVVLYVLVGVFVGWLNWEEDDGTSGKIFRCVQGVCILPLVALVLPIGKALEWNERRRAGVCKRWAGHDGPCNGLPRDTCPTLTRDSFGGGHNPRPVVAAMAEVMGECAHLWRTTARGIDRDADSIIERNFYVCERCGQAQTVSERTLLHPPLARPLPPPPPPKDTRRIRL